MPRATWRKRSAAERLADFLEINGPYSEATAQEQARPAAMCNARTPSASPAALLYTTGSLPEIAAHACASERLCEAICILNDKARPMSIRAVEQFLNEYAFAHGEANLVLAAPNGLRVAVVGAGPGGLACADALSRRKIGDWSPVDCWFPPRRRFAWSGPCIERRIDLLRERGVKFKLDVRLEREFTYGDLPAKYDAI